MKYYILKSSKWERLHQYFPSEVAKMRQINLYDLINGKMIQIGIGLY